MARSRVYTVHVRAWASSSDRDAVFVREGFAWGAFLLSLVWALWHRLWLGALIILGVTAVLAIALDLLIVDETTETAVGIAWALIVGWEANDWRRRALERRGYVTAGVVAAPNLLEAERRFFAKRVGAQAA
jgi:hypothetical protein